MKDMRVLVLGAGGMIGSVLVKEFGFQGTTHAENSWSPQVLPNIDITDRNALHRALAWAKPEAVINCVGIVKSECDKHVSSRVTAVNGSAPHMLAELTAPLGCRVIHISTDCVFDGTRGPRTEDDIPDANDLYGQSKIAGELLDYPHCVTLRTSFIGRDYVHQRGLLEWLLDQKEEAVGYTHAMWSGFSTHELARVIGSVLLNTNLRGLYNVAGPLISKADLLQDLIDAYGLTCRVKRVDEPHIDRSLDGSRFSRATGYTPIDWPTMAKELAA